HPDAETDPGAPGGGGPAIIAIAGSLVRDCAGAAVASQPARGDSCGQETGRAPARVGTVTGKTTRSPGGSLGLPYNASTGQLSILSDLRVPDWLVEGGYTALMGLIRDPTRLEFAH